MILRTTSASWVVCYLQHFWEVSDEQFVPTLSGQFASFVPQACSVAASDVDVLLEATSFEPHDASNSNETPKTNNIFFDI